MSNDLAEISRKREALKNAYPASSTWHYKVDRMPPAQVIAVHLRLSSQGKLGK